MEVMKKYHISRILVIALVIVSLVAYSCYTAPKAYAEAFTLTSLFLMLVMSVMASLGVTLLSSALQDGIDYLHDQYVDFVANKGFSNIEDYLVSAGITSAVKLATPVFGAINIGKTVYDMIVEFCDWLFAEENVVSGGEDVGQAPTTVYPAILGNSIYNNSTITCYSVAPTSEYQRLFRKTSFNSYPVYFYFNDNYFLSVELYNGSNRRMSIRQTNSSTVLWSYNIATYYSNSYMSLDVRVRDDNIQFRVRTANDSSSTGNVWSNPFSIPATDFYNTVLDTSPSKTPGFLISPSATVLEPPDVALGQNYSVNAVGVTANDSLENALSTVVAPLSTTAGLTTTANVSGSAVPAEWAWLYEGVESIKNNTSDDRHGTDFIPSGTTMDLGFWHYVPDWISSVGAGFAMLVGVVTSLPSIMLAPLYGILVLGIVVALFHKLWGS